LYTDSTFNFSFLICKYKSITCGENTIQVLLPSLHSSLCIHDARNFDEYTQVLAGGTTNKMAFLGGEEGAALCIALLCNIDTFCKKAIF
jgi:hypothetical protein